MSYTDDDDDDDDYRQTFLSPHERSFLGAELDFHELSAVVDADLEFAYKLQLQEAINASLTPNDGASASSPNKSQPQTSRDIHNFHLRVHDHSVKREAPRIPHRELARNSGEGSSNGAGKGSGLFRLYVKGLVSEEGLVLNGGGRKAVLSGIGVAICDERDVVVAEMRKPLIGNGSSKTAAEVKALIEGFNAALALEIKRLVVYIDYYPVYQFITGRWPPKQRKIALLINQAFLLRRKFTYCNTKFVARNDIKYAFRLARDAIVSQMTSPVESSQGKKINKTCVICLEDTNVEQMFSIDRCRHQYCFSCMKQHVEVKLLHGILPKCPHDGCKSELYVESCRKFLTAKLIETWSHRIREASIPVAERLYCPHPKCSALMSRTEVTEYAKDTLLGAQRSGARKCIKCHGLFCINCKVPWHSSLTCRDYKMLHPNPPTEDVKLKSLASRNLWRQCVKCNHMIELAEGCFHMTCRCGYEFCYNCGQEWKNKRPTCSCPLWDEDNIWHGEDRNFDDDEDDEDEYDEYYESDSDENYLVDEYYFM